MGGCASKPTDNNSSDDSSSSNASKKKDWLAKIEQMGEKPPAVNNDNFIVGFDDVEVSNRERRVTFNLSTNHEKSRIESAAKSGRTYAKIRENQEREAIIYRESVERSNLRNCIDSELEKILPNNYSVRPNWLEERQEKLLLEDIGHKNYPQAPKEKPKLGSVSFGASRNPEYPNTSAAKASAESQKSPTTNPLKL